MFENPKKVTSKDLSESSIDHLYTSLQNSLSTKKATQKSISLNGEHVARMCSARCDEVWYQFYLLKGECKLSALSFYVNWLLKKLYIMTFGVS